MTTRQTNRRQFLQASTAAGVGYWVAGGVQAKESTSALETINFGCIGVGGKGQSDSNDAARHGNVAAICDIDDNNLGKAAARWPKARKFNDYRKMIEEFGDSIDAVTVSIPDHSHAPASSLAIKAGKHCFTQKPLTHSIEEARVLGELAKKHGVQSQMGNQGTASSNLRKTAALIQAGLLGSVSEVHVWTNRPVWPQGNVQPKEGPVPAHIHWDEFLGPAKHRAYAPDYHPFKWRGWWDFGTGALGDMACHTLNLPFMALELKDPLSVVAESAEHDKQTYPGWSVITFEFPALGKRGPVKLVWYDGGKKPAANLFPAPGIFTNSQGKKVDAGQYRKVLNTGSLMIGDKGSLLSPGDYGWDTNYTGVLANNEWIPQAQIKEPSVEIVESPGHFTEYANAIKGGPAPRSNFADYAGPLTEVILLGNLAVWVSGKKVEWDAAKLKATNAPEVAEIVRKKYQNGYGI
jgi:predicted dehydrogenase